MNGAGSDDPVIVESAEPAVESDDRPTRFGYGDGGVPLYVGLVWVAFIVCYLVVMSVVALPDLLAWISS